MTIDFPCKCGHKRSDHKYDSYGQLICGIYNGVTPSYLSAYLDDCVAYTPDNLKYLEQKYDKLSNGI